MAQQGERLNPSTALAALIALVMIGLAAIVGLTLAERDTAQVIYFLAPFVGALVPVLISALRAERTAHQVAQTQAAVDEILNGGPHGMAGTMRAELDRPAAPGSRDRQGERP